MKIMTTYKTKIRDSHRALANTVGIYRQAVDFLIGVALEEWNALKEIERSLGKQRAIECAIHHTKSNPCPKYDFDSRFGKFPSYLRRAAITEAVGKVSSYKNNYANWEENPQGKEPGLPVAGYIYPAMYRDNCFVRTGTYTARLKVWIRNTWDWLDVQLRKPIVADKIHRDGVRVRRVCAWNTSKLAFDGSGEVERDEHNYSMCTFKTGKRYHCDLSASYNIGAQYFIRMDLQSNSNFAHLKPL